MTKWSMCYVTLWVGFPHPKSPASKVWVHRPCESGNITFFILSRDRDIEESRDFVGEGPLILSHHLAKIGVHRPYESGDITFFICHVNTISKSHVILWVGAFHPKSPLC